MKSFKLKIPRAWIISIVGALFFCFAFAQLNLINSLSQFLLAAWQITPMQLSLLSSIYLCGLALFFIPMGILLDHVSTRKLMLIFMGIGVFVTFIFINSKHFFVAATVRFLLGAIHALAFLSSMRLVTQWLPKQKALGMGVVFTIALSGGLFVQLPLTKLILLIGWQNALYSLCLFGIISWLLIYLFIEDKPGVTADFLPYSFKTWLENLKLAIRNIQNWLCGIYTCMLNLPLLIFGALWGNLFLVQTKHLILTQASHASTMLFLGFMIGSPLGGWLSDKLARRKIIMIWGALISLIVFLFILMQTSFYILLFLFFSLGVISSTQILSYAVMAESNPVNVASTALSFASIIIMGGGALFQSLFTLLITNQPKLLDNTFNYAYADIFLFFSLSLSLLAALFLKEIKPG